MLEINGYVANYNNLYIYEGDKILFETSRPYELDLEIKNMSIRSARKLNFDKNDCFEIKSTKETYSLSVNGKDLYIPASIISVESKNEILALQAHGETNYKNEFVLELHCEAYRWNKHVEKVTDLPADMLLSDYDSNGKWGTGFSKTLTMYHESENPITKESSVFKQWLTYDKMEKITVESDFYTRTEKTPERIACEEIARIMEECSISNAHISHYDVERMMERLNISIKEN